jgi:hypothetical protein
MIMTSGIMSTTTCENIISPQNNLESPSTNMHIVQQRRSRVPIYTNYVGDDINLGGDDDGDADVVVDDEDGTSPQAKGVPMAMMVSNSPWRQPRSNMISPLPEMKRIIASIAVLENYIKIRA